MTQWMFWCLGIVLFLLTLPGTIELALITIGGMARRKKQPPIGEFRHVRLGAIVPVFNEESGLARTVHSLAACQDPLPTSDIIVAACNTTDRSVQIARELGCTVIERIDPTRRGKGYGLNNAFRKLAGKGYDAYLIIDADTVVDSNFLNEFRKLFARGGDAGQAILRVANHQANLRTRLMNIAFLAFTYLRPLARHNIGLSSGLFGNGFGVSAKTVMQVPYECFSIAEDLEYHAELIVAGKHAEFLPSTAVYTEMCNEAASAKPQRERWEGGRLRVLLDYGPRLALNAMRRRTLTSFEPLLELLLLPLAYHLLLLTILALISSGMLLAYAVLGMLLVLVHVCQAMRLGRVEAEDWKALLSTPFYIGWKLLNLGGIIAAAHKHTPWIRTKRRQA